MTKGIKSEAKLAEQKEHPIKMGVRMDALNQVSSPTISVIVPVWNTKSTLQRCIDTILAQTYQDFEIIIVDDGSPDGAGELCDQIAKRHHNIRVLHQKNAGLSSARNAALKVAKGEYLTFVDSDDTIFPDMLEVLVGLREDPVRICSFAEITLSDKSRPIAGALSFAQGPITPDEVERQSLTVETCLRRMLLEQGFTMSACGKLYHRDLFKTVQFPIGKLYEDVGTTYRLIMQCPHHVSFVPLPLYEYHQNHDSIIHQKFNFQKLDLITLTDQMCDEIDQKFPKLQDITNLRRMHARFSILRQMVLAKPDASDAARFQQVEQEIIQYLRQNKAWVLRNPDADRRDRLAMISLLLGRSIFKLAWKLYSRLR